jgi:hypothetical protein
MDTRQVHLHALQPTPAGDVAVYISSHESFDEAEAAKQKLRKTIKSSWDMGTVRIPTGAMVIPNFVAGE